MVGGCQVVHGELLRTHSINGDLPVVLNAGEPGKGNPGLRATVPCGAAIPRTIPGNARPWSTRTGSSAPPLPRQPMAGKVEYEVEVQSDPDFRDPNLRARARGSRNPLLSRPRTTGRPWPASRATCRGIILAFHVTFMILGMLFSTACGPRGL
jgi:hypothetical protein